ncbi:MAG: synthase protein [Acetobacterium sp.]|jgi:F0F1-type ATP synthase assembly protein I|uniref:AtpZ/AtpI family protein n=1 Tax=unclassified Acetobacterium TaxID=2638182 RepID=UPI000DBEC413|nr:MULTISPECIES: AtpZ/AtpI family protein [unclassified Acetobacterium]AWW27141.1 F0F1-ATPase subunit [Acetobacterium sp. KB-1]MDK2942733.1 synthase protein [Acetobacterium sp.]MDZ5724342.1 AtpZ/AtpI family protein [Acetobacterium sp. K1/6]
MKRGKEKPYKYLAMISQIGISVLVPVGMMIVIGKVLDFYFHTGNLLVIILAVVGVMAGLRNLYVIPLRMSEKALKRDAENKTEEEKEQDKKRAQEYRDQVKRENDENDKDF